MDQALLFIMLCKMNLTFASEMKTKLGQREDEVLSCGTLQDH